MDIHELNMVFQLTTSPTNTLRKDHLSQVLLLLTEHVENYAVNERICKSIQHVYCFEISEGMACRMLLA